MAATLNLSDPESLNDQSASSRSSNRSVRVAEKERRKNEAGDPFVLALKYFSDGRWSMASRWRRQRLQRYWLSGM